MTTAVLCEGYLTKSPPEHKINRARWCKRFFQLCNTDGEILLQYYKDNTCNKLKGTINLRECEQVDQGLSFETKSKLKDAHIFDVVTQRRKYFLVTESEGEMLRWVQSICSACGFQSEDSLSDITDGAERPVSGLSLEPMSLESASPVATRIDHTTAAQQPQTNGDESYIHITECETGDLRPQPACMLPPKLNLKEGPRLPQGLDDTVSSSSSSGAPSDSAPSPPNSRPTSQLDGGVMEDIYDVPPARVEEMAPPVPRRPSVTLEESVYKVVPACKDPTSFKFDRQISSATSNRGSFSNPEDSSGTTYDIVPGTNSDRGSSGLFDSCESDDIPPPVPPPPPVTEDIYQVPPSRQPVEHDPESVYDVPPVSQSLAESTYDILPSPLQKTPMQTIPSHLKNSEQISKSTDDLARSFEEISQHNAHQSITNGDLEHSTYDPVPALDLNASIGSTCSFGSVFTEMGASSTAIEAPPRPAKPAYMCPSTPPSSVDETYVAPTLPNHQISPKEVRRRLTSIETHHHHHQNAGNSPQRNGPNPPSMGSHHMWMDQVIPVGYANTKRAGTTVGLRPNSAFSPKGYMHMRSKTVSGGRTSSGAALGFQNGHPGGAGGPAGGQQPLGSYMAMQGSSEGAKLPPLGGLGGAITEECYMHMQSQNEASPSPDVYTNMHSQVPQGGAAPAIPRRPPRASTSSTISISSTASLDSMPPPIDRRNKPRSTDSAILNPEMIGLEGSFYATGPELPPDFPVQNPRTKSFSKRPSSHRHREPPQGPPSTPPRPHRSIHSSSGSHTDHSLAGDMYSVPLSATSLSDDSYVFTDQPTAPAKPRMDFHHFQTRHSSSIDSPVTRSPSLPPRSHTVEYLELDHDSDAPSSSPSTLSRAAKPTSPQDQVEYIHLDLEKTKALQEVTQNREECYRPKNGDSGTLKK